MTICLILGMPLTCYLIMRIVKRRKWNRLRNRVNQAGANKEFRNYCLETFKKKGQGITPIPFDEYAPKFDKEKLQQADKESPERQEVLPKVLIARPQYVEIARRLLQATSKMKVIIRKKSPFIDIEKQKQADEIARNLRIMPEEYVISYEE